MGIKNKTMVNNKNSGNVVSLSEEIIENVKKVSIPADNEVDFIAPEDDIEDIELVEDDLSKIRRKNKKKRKDRQVERDSVYSGSPERKRNKSISGDMHRIQIDDNSDKENEQ